MASFDPAAATAAYLAQMPAAAQAKAVAYTQGAHWLLLWGWLVTLAACWIILKSRILSSVEARLEAQRPKPLLASFLLALAFLLADYVLELPWASYAQWWREAQYGLTSQSWMGWFSDGFKVTLVSLPLVAFFFLGLYALMRFAPRIWPLWAGALAAGFMTVILWLAPVFIEPMINTYKAAPPGPVRDAVVALGKANNVPTDKIYVYNGSKQSNRYTANVAGLFGTARVALSDTMFAKGADLSEIRGVVGHEMGHYVHRHALVLILQQGLMAVLAGWLIQRLFPLVRRLLRAHEVGGVADPAGLPIVMMIFATLALVAGPVNNTVSRWIESDADAFSLERAREPDGLSAALIKTAEYRAPTPSAIEEALFYDHPSVGRRIRAGMDWKAAHLSEVEARAPAPASAPLATPAPAAAPTP
jgi:STE24 endopeptidase